MGAFAGRGETWKEPKKSYNMSHDDSAPDILTTWVLGVRSWVLGVGSWLLALNSRLSTFDYLIR